MHAVPQTVVLLVVLHAHRVLASRELAPLSRCATLNIEESRSWDYAEEVDEIVHSEEGEADTVSKKVITGVQFSYRFLVPRW